MPELWDVYDRNRNRTGRLVERGNPLEPGGFHLVVHVWIHNGLGEWLISKRSPEKAFWPNMWEATGGAAIAGDDSLTAALREVSEELGIRLNPQRGSLKKTLVREESDYGNFCDVWIFEHDCSIDEIVFQEGETCDAMWATKSKIREMIRDQIFVPFSYIDEVIGGS